MEQAPWIPEVSSNCQGLKYYRVTPYIKGTHKVITSNELLVRIHISRVYIRRVLHQQLFELLLIVPHIHHIQNRVC